MLTNLNEKYLLKFISSANLGVNPNEGDLFDVLKTLGIKVKFNNTNAVYDLIDKLEYAGIYYE